MRLEDGRGNDRDNNFNPRTREGCDLQTKLQQLVAKIFQSTHPRRVRRTLSLVSKLPILISIHAPAKGATLQNPKVLFAFNISIHALTGSATRFNKFRIFYKQNFNPRTHGECDTLPVDLSFLGFSFQSTHSRGVRRFHYFRKTLSIGFQSTHSRGVRHVRHYLQMI